MKLPSIFTFHYFLLAANFNNHSNIYSTKERNDPVPVAEPCSGPNSHDSQTNTQFYRQEIDVIKAINKQLDEHFLNYYEFLKFVIMNI